MHCKILSGIIVAVLISGFAGAQSTNAEKKDNDNKVSLSLINTAANVFANTQQASLNDFFAAFVDSKTWDSALKDSDLGPFLKLKEKKQARSVVFFIAPKGTLIAAVFFDGNSAFGVTWTNIGDGKIESNALSAKYQPVSNEMLKDSGQRLQFTQGDISTDDGDSIPAYQITSIDKSH